MIIDLRDITVFQDEKQVLTNASLQVNEGEFVYLIGRVGSGKSTLLRTLYAEVPIHSGEAKVMDFDLMNIKRKHLPELRRAMGIVFQNFLLLRDRTAYDNLDFVLHATGWKKKEEREARINEVLELVHFPTERIHKFPHELSGGEQQRIAIARAILNSPKLILADEPTGNLDKQTTDEIMSIMTNLSKNGTAIIMATHNLSLLDEYPAKVYECRDEHLIALQGD